MNNFMEAIHRDVLELFPVDLRRDPRFNDGWYLLQDRITGYLRAQGGSALPARQLVDQWRPIETAPKDGMMIIGALIVGPKIWRVHEMRHNGLAFYTAAGGSLPKMTHWLPMPALAALLDPAPQLSEKKEDLSRIPGPSSSEPMSTRKPLKG